MIARQAGEILVLRQTIDAMVRRVFGKSSEKLDSAQTQLMPDLGEIATPPGAFEAPGAAPEIKQPDHKSAKKRRGRAPRIPEYLQVMQASEAWCLTPANWQKARSGKEIRKSA